MIEVKLKSVNALQLPTIILPCIPLLTSSMTLRGHLLLLLSPPNSEGLFIELKKKPDAKRCPAFGNQTLALIAEDSTGGRKFDSIPTSTA